MNISTLLTVVEYGLPALFVVYCLYGMGFWIYQGKKLQQTGYMPPPSSKFARWFYKRACHVFAFLFVGPVKVIGRENALFEGRGLVLPNHQFAMDFAVVGLATPFSYRQVAKAKELLGLVRGTLAAWIGTVGVQVEGGKAQDGGSNTVITTGKDILVNSKGARLLLFPQGMLVWDNVLRPKEFRTGATRILQATLAEIGEDPLYVLPMAIEYHRDPKHATRLTKILHGLGIKAFRRWRDYELVINADGTKTKKPRVYTTYGATCVIGKPIDVRTLSKDPREAIEAVRVNIQGLLDQAQGKTATAA
ncbi:MAG: 1-acyl-sn-glycerol-3-phosphate acyltransferase [Cyanobacteria bacterium SZAS LIN-3]|nr:1-acyl-sn-glycerol-3-phosphate acyltransferase [Cyanobacteria bacterium SZAS LIN-3]